MDQPSDGGRERVPPAPTHLLGTKGQNAWGEELEPCRSAVASARSRIASTTGTTGRPSNAASGAVGPRGASASP